MSIFNQKQKVVPKLESLDDFWLISELLVIFDAKHGFFDLFPFQKRIQ